MTAAPPAAAGAPPGVDSALKARELRPHRRAGFRRTLLVGLAILAVFPLWWPPFERALSGVEQALTGLLPLDLVAGARWVALPAIGLLGGLLASISPCVLPLVPLNAAYIGAAGVPAARVASVSARFVLGAVLALSVLGLFADLAGAVFIEYRGPLRIAVGGVLVLLGAIEAELLPAPRLPVPGGARRLGPVAAGAAFALLTTPCASPVLFAVLTAAGAQGVPGLSAVTMAAFAVGYTALVFAAGLVGGRATAGFRRHSPSVQSISAAVLMVAGLGFAASGMLWFL